MSVPVKWLMSEGEGNNKERESEKKVIIKRGDEERQYFWHQFNNMDVNHAKICLQDYNQWGEEGREH